MRALITAIACWGIGCAGATPNAPPVGYRASDAALFDQSLDLVSDPVIVEGQWGGAFERRVARADVIAAVRTDSLVNEVVKRQAAYRLSVEVKEHLKGGSAREILLQVSDQEPGYRSVEDNEDRLLHDGFIAFIKWEAQQGSDGPHAHWHLSPDSLAVRRKIEHVLRLPAPDPNTQVEVVGP